MQTDAALTFSAMECLCIDESADEKYAAAGGILTRSKRDLASFSSVCGGDTLFRVINFIHPLHCIHQKQSGFEI